AILVNDLCAGILPANVDDPGLDGERRGLPREVDRALRNMCGLAKRQEKSAEGKRITIDPIADMASGRNLEALASEVFKRLDPSKRTVGELWYDGGSGQEPGAWLREMFAGVNNGRIEGIGLPRQITVIAPLPGLANSPYDLRLIDTKGIDEPLADRPDLR